MVRAVAYTRFSSDLQREESIEAQTRAIRTYCEQNDIVLLTVYADRGISGTSDKRPEFQRMISDSSKGSFDVILVHKLDRFARNRYDSAFYKNILKKHKVRLISVLENIQDTPESIILESVIEGMNEYYSRNLSREVRKGLQENALECKATGGPPALGYSVDPATQKYIINEYEAEAVRTIFRMFLEGCSYKEIIDHLNGKGYRTRRGLPFAKNSLHEILRNERYCGIYVYIKDATKNPKGKYSRHANYDPEAIIKIPGGIPAIISESDFKHVQAKMSERRHKTAKFSAKQEYLLSGKVFCGVCCSPYAGNSRRPRPDHTLYISYKCTKRNQREDCKNPEISRDKLEAIVLDKLSSTLFNPDMIPKLIREYNSYILNRSGSVKERVTALSQELSETGRKISNTVNLMVETGSAAFKDKLRELEQHKEKVQYELIEAEAMLKQAYFSESDILNLFQSAKNQLREGTLSIRRSVTDQYINKIIIYTDRIEIYINLVNDYVLKEVVKQK